MNWDDLRVFLAVARGGSLSAAGLALKMDPATVGRRIARLEAGFGRALFLKSQQGYALSAGGERLLPRAEAAEAALEGAPGELSGSAAGLGGTIRIGAPDGCANYLLPQAVAGIAKAHPGLDIQVIALARVFNLSKREADIAVTVSAPRTGRLTGSRIAEYELVLAASETYLAEAPPIAAPGDLKVHRIVGYVPDMIFDSELDYLAEAGIHEVNLASNSASVQGQLLRAGAGVGIVHRFMLPLLPGVRAVLADRIRLKRTFWMVAHADDRRSDRVSRFGDLLTAAMRDELARLEAEA